MVEAPVISVCIAKLQRRRHAGGAPALGALAASRRDGELWLIASDSNVGFCVANNRMDAVARGDYLLLFNNGALLPPQLLSIPFAEAYRSRTPH